MKKMKSILALCLTVCMLAGLIPVSLPGELYTLRTARAEEGAAPAETSEVLSDGAWLYRIRSDGYAEVLGYTDTTVTSLTMPDSLGGAWVVAIGENAFADNVQLSRVTIGTAISEINPSAFPAQERMTVSAYNGSAAIAFANLRGFSVSNRSEYDFFDNIIDLSGMKSSQYSVSSSSVQISMPYAHLIEVGSQLFLPLSNAYSKGVPVEVTAVSQQGEAVRATFTELGFMSALETYKANDLDLTPDPSGIIILDEGFSLNNAVSRSSYGGDIGSTLSFNLDKKIKERGKVKGTLTIDMKYSMSIDYEWFEVKSVSYNSKSTQSFDVNFSYTLINGSEEIDSFKADGEIKFAAVPMVSSGLLSAWVTLGLDFTVDGSIKINTSIVTTESFSHSKSGTTSSKTKRAELFDISAAAKLKIGLKPGVVLRLGFGEKFSIDVAKIEAAVGVSVSLSTTEFMCVDLDINGYFTVEIKVGILKISDGDINPGVVALLVDAKIIDIKWDIVDAHEERGKIVEKCTKGDYASVTFHYGNGSVAKKIEVKKGSKITEPDKPSKAGYQFLGWYTDLLTGAYWRFDERIVDDDITLYAGWTLIPEDGSTPAPGTTPEPSIAPEITPTPKPDDYVYTEDEEASLPYLVYDVVDKNEMTCAVSLGEGEPTSLAIPSYIDGYKVVETDDDGFRNCDSLVSVVLPRTMKIIGSYSFYDCDNLKSIEIPSGITTIEGYAFMSCDSLLDLRIDDAQLIINGSAFQDCASLETVRILNTDLVFDAGLLDSHYFSNCKNLKEVQITGYLETVGDYAFYGCTSLEDVSLPNTVTQISEYAFYNCDGLTEAPLSDNLEIIEQYAFYDCDGIENLEIPSGVTSIGIYAFKECDSLKELRIEDSELTIKGQAFRECDSLETVRILNTNLILADTGLYDDSHFANCKNLREVQITGYLEKVSDYAFYGCTSLKDVSLPNTVTQISEYAFYNCDGLTEAPLSDNLETIEQYAFYDCDGIENLEIPSGVTWISIYAFHDCDSLREVEIEDAELTIKGQAFRECAALETVRILNTNLILADTGLYDDSHFANCKNLREVQITGYLEKIGDYAFYGCTSLKDVSLPNTVTQISEYAFYNCDGLVEAPLSDNLEIIEQYAFYDCDNLACVEIPDNVTSVGNYAFNRCDSLQFVSLPNSVESIGNYAFDNCDKLQVARVESLSGYPASFFSEKHPEVILITDDSDLAYVEFNCQGGSSVGAKIAAVDDLLSEPTQPTRENYTFTGWHKDAACTEPWNFAKDTVPEGGLTLYAGWTYEPVDFEYDITEDGVVITGYAGDDLYVLIPEKLAGVPVVALAESSIPSGVRRVTLPATIENISGKAFRWAEDLRSIVVEGEGNYTAADGVLYTQDGMLVCYPQAKSGESYAILEGTKTIGSYAFCANDSLVSLSVPASVEKLAEYSIYDCLSLLEVDFAADPVSIGSGTLTGCDYSMAVTGPIEAPVLINYIDARYMNYNKYIITYVEHGEVVGYSAARAGSLLGAPPAPDDTDLTFYGWSTVEDGSSVVDFSTMLMPKEELTLYAVWRYDFASKSVTGGVELTQYTGKKTVIRVPEDIDGKTVVSIADDAFGGLTGITLVGNKGSVTQNYAATHGYAFTPLTYTVAFVSNGGTYAAPQTLCATDLVTKPEVIRTGYELLGWHQVNSPDVYWNFDTDTMPIGGLTLYAAWNKTDSSVSDVPFAFDTGADGLIITGYIGTKTSAEIPEQINGIPVVAIGEYAFYSDDKLLKVTVPGSVKSIGKGAFAYSRLGSITLEDGVESIGEKAFAECAELSDVTLAESITSIGSDAFQGNISLMSIDLPDSVAVLKEGVFSDCTFLSDVELPAALETIESYAFSDCRYLESVYFGARVSEIAANAFSGCTALDMLGVSSSNMYLSVKDNVLFSKDGTRLMLYPQGKTTSSYTVPNGTTMIADQAMQRSRIKTLILNDSLSYIGASALRSSSYLKEIEFAENGALEGIGQYAFAGCYSLSELVFPESLMNIEKKAFYGIELTSVTVPEYTYLGDECLSASDGLTIYGVMGSSAEMYADYHGIRFVDLSEDIPITEITVDESVMLYVGGSKKLNVVLEPENTTETDVTFATSNATVAVVDHEGVVTARSVGEATIMVTAANGMQASCAVRVIRKTVPVKRIQISGNSVIALNQTTLLTAIISPSNATNKDIIWRSSNENIVTVTSGGIVIGNAVGEAEITATAADGSGVSWSQTVIVYDSTYEAPTAVPPPTPTPTPYMKNVLELPKALRIIAAEAFYGATTIDKVILPEKVTEIRSKAFANSTLQVINLPAYLCFIADDAFAGCDLLYVTVIEGSYAHEWVAQKGIEFYTEEGELPEIPITPEPVTPAPITPEPVTPEPVTPEPVTPEPVTPEPVTPEPVTPEPVTPEPVTPEPVTPEPVTPEPVTPEPVTPDPVTPEPVTPEPVTPAPEKRSIEWHDICAGSTYDSAGNLTGFLLQGMFWCESDNLDGFVASNTFGAEIGHKTFLVETYGYMYFSFWLPNDPTLEGWHTITLSYDDVEEYVAFRLEYLGDYSSIVGTPDSVNGLGWVVSEWMPVTDLIESAPEVTITPKPEVTITPTPALEYDFSYEIVDGACVISGYTGDGSELVIPSVVDGYPVTEIKDYAFYERSDLKQIVFPETLKKIGNYAVYKCSGLMSVVIPESVVRIGSSGFAYCTNLKSVDMPTEMEYLGSHAFQHCISLTDIAVSAVPTLSTSAFNGCVSLERVTLREGIEEFHSGVFTECSKLKVVEIPEGTIILGYDLFRGCTKLERVIVPASVTTIRETTFDGCTSAVIQVESGSYAETYCKNNSINYVVIGDETPVPEVTTAPTEIPAPEESSFAYAIENGCCTITGYTGSNSSVIIPEEIDGARVTAIGERAFYNFDDLERVSIPDSIVSIGAYAFSGCLKLQSANIPAEVTSIGEFAFYNCMELEGVCIPESVTSIGTCAFSGCSSFTDLKIPGSVSSIGNDAFSGCTALTSVEIQEGVVSIGQYAFHYCGNLQSVSIPESVNSIGTEAFADCPILSVTVVVGSYAEVYCQENGIPIGCYIDNEIPSPVVTYPTITDYMINGKSSEVTVAIGDILNLSGTVTAGIGDKLKALQVSVFKADDTSQGVAYYHTGTIDVDLFDLSSVPAIAVGEILSDTSGFVMEDGNSYYVRIYVTDSNGNGFENDEVHQIIVHVIGQETPASSFVYTIANGEATIDEFIGNETEVVIPTIIEGYPVTRLGFDAFAMNDSLQSVVIPESVEIIDSYVFSYCSTLKKVSLPKSLREIGSSAFSRCSSLQVIDLNDGLRRIDDSAFSNCVAITSVAIPASVTHMGQSVFYGCKALTRVTIPASVTYIGGSAFVYCADGLVICGERSSYAQAYAQQNGYRFAVLGAEDQTVPNVEYAFKVENGEATLLLYSGSGERVNIPSEYNGYPVTAIATDAFHNNQTITDLVVPEGVREIGMRAFCSMQNLLRVSLPESLTTLGDHAFQASRKLKSIDLPENLTHIGEYAFATCDALAYVEIPDSVVQIGASAFASNRSLTEVIIDDGVRQIGRYAFKGCSALTRVTIPASITEIGEDALFQCSDELVVYGVPGSDAEAYAREYAIAFAQIGGGLLFDNEYGYKIEDDAVIITAYDGVASSITLPKTMDGYPVKRIGDGAFDRNDRLVSVTIPEGVTSIGMDAFWNCPNLESVTIPASVTNIGWDAFSVVSPEFVIRGYAGSAAQLYAEENYIQFVILSN